MISLTITALTPAGEKAIITHFKESKKVIIMAQMLGYKQELGKGNPLRLYFRITRKELQVLLKEEDLKNKVIEAFKDNGAILDVDYSINVI